eukprot:c19870_g1_i1 orf=251-559(+)
MPFVDSIMARFNLRCKLRPWQSKQSTPHPPLIMITSPNLVEVGRSILLHEGTHKEKCMLCSLNLNKLHLKRRVHLNEGWIHQIQFCLRMNMDQPFLQRLIGL